MLKNNLVGQGEADSRPPFLGAEKGIKYPLKLIRWNALATIFDFNFQVSLSELGGHHYGTGIAYGLIGIPQEIHECLPKLILIGSNKRELVG